MTTPPAPDNSDVMTSRHFRALVGFLLIAFTVIGLILEAIGKGIVTGLLKTLSTNKIALTGAQFLILIGFIYGIAFLAGLLLFQRDAFMDLASQVKSVLPFINKGGSNVSSGS